MNTPCDTLDNKCIHKILFFIMSILVINCVIFTFYKNIIEYHACFLLIFVLCQIIILLLYDYYNTFNKYMSLFIKHKCYISLFYTIISCLYLFTIFTKDLKFMLSTSNIDLILSIVLIIIVNPLILIYWNQLKKENVYNIFCTSLIGIPLLYISRLLHTPSKDSFNFRNYITIELKNIVIKLNYLFFLFIIGRLSTLLFDYIKITFNNITSSSLICVIISLLYFSWKNIPILNSTFIDIFTSFTLSPILFNNYKMKIYQVYIAITLILVVLNVINFFLFQLLLLNKKIKHWYNSNLSVEELVITNKIIDNINICDITWIILSKKSPIANSNLKLKTIISKILFIVPIILNSILGVVIAFPYIYGFSSYYSITISIISIFFLYVIWNNIIYSYSSKILNKIKYEEYYWKEYLLWESIKILGDRGRIILKENWKNKLLELDLLFNKLEFYYKELELKKEENTEVLNIINEIKSDHYYNIIVKKNALNWGFYFKNNYYTNIYDDTTEELKLNCSELSDLKTYFLLLHVIFLYIGMISSYIFINILNYLILVLISVSGYLILFLLYYWKNIYTFIKRYNDCNIDINDIEIYFESV